MSGGRAREMAYQVPLWWLWLTTVISITARGDDYYAIPRGDWRMAIFVANVVYLSCRSIRADHGAGTRR